jgi:cytochrome c
MLTRMMMIRCLIVFAVIQLVCGCGKSDKPAPTPTTQPSGAAPTASEPPASEKSKQIHDLVEKAAAFIESKGKDAAFAEFRKPNSEWFNGETYVFAYDPDVNVLLNPAFPEKEGLKGKGKKDTNGKLFHDELVNVAKTKGSGWVDYMLPKPGAGDTPVRKWSYVKAVKVEGVVLVGAGFYE